LIQQQFGSDSAASQDSQPIVSAQEMQNHFDLFHLPQQFTIDLSVLDSAYHSVQNQVHPDKFVHASDAEKRVAMQWATRANEAYKTLKSPFKRAAYLCELNGVDLQTESNTAMPVDFLMQQMEWREALDDARAQKNQTELEALDAAIRSARKLALADIGKLLDGDDFTQAAGLVRQLMFLEKFADEVSGALDALSH
jgi:molecular chaperone HscB